MVWLSPDEQCFTADNMLNIIWKINNCAILLKYETEQTQTRITTQMNRWQNNYQCQSMK